MSNPIKSASNFCTSSPMDGPSAFPFLGTLLGALIGGGQAFYRASSMVSISQPCDGTSTCTQTGGCCGSASSGGPGVITRDFAPILS